MTVQELTAKSFTEWAKGNNSNRLDNPENLPEESPWGKIECIDEGRDRDNPNIYYSIIKVAGRHFRLEGYYSSWDGVDWSYDSDAYEEVQLVTKTVEVWKNVPR